MSLFQSEDHKQFDHLLIDLLSRCSDRRRPAGALWGEAPLASTAQQIQLLLLGALGDVASRTSSGSETMTTQSSRKSAEGSEQLEARRSRTEKKNGYQTEVFIQPLNCSRTGFMDQLPTRTRTRWVKPSLCLIRNHKLQATT